MSVLIRAASAAEDDPAPSDERPAKPPVVPAEPPPFPASSAAMSGTSCAISADSGRLDGTGRPAAITWLTTPIASAQPTTATRGRTIDRVRNWRIIEWLLATDRAD